MKKLFFVLIAFVLFSSHDMFLKLDTYFLQSNETAGIKLFNGTFDQSENVIARNRMVDVSLVGNGIRAEVDTAQWSEKDHMTILNFTTGEPGTWVAGVSTAPRNIELAAADFNDYLEHDGVMDMLEWRKQNDALEQDAVEKYSKHVKAIFQVGDQISDDWQTVLGYPIEFVPLENPYDMHPGHALRVQLLWRGKPLANQLVYIGTDAAEDAHTHDHEHTDETAHEHTDAAAHEHADDHDHQHADAGEHEHDHEHADEAGHEHPHEHADGTTHDHDHADATAHEHEHEDVAAEDDHHHEAAMQARTDAEGILSVNLTGMGIWYLRTIHMAASEEAGLTHESNWATLTFEVGEGLGHSHGEVAHSHEDEGGFPSYVFWIGSLVLLGGLFFWFNRKQ